MLFSFAVLLILCGLAVMVFGLFLFYAWLPILYALFGWEIGLLLGHWLTGGAGLAAIILGICGAVGMFCATYLLEPYRRVLIGFSGGALIALSLGFFLGLDQLLSGIVGTGLMIVGGIVGAIIVPQIFNALVVGTSAFGGATMVMTGLHLLMPTVGLFDRLGGGLPPRLLTILLAVIGIGWQLRNIERWAHLNPMLDADVLSGTSGEMSSSKPAIRPPAP
jgi:hypothetical protein